MMPNFILTKSISSTESETIKRGCQRDWKLLCAGANRCSQSEFATAVTEENFVWLRLSFNSTIGEPRRVFQRICRTRVRLEHGLYQVASLNSTRWVQNSQKIGAVVRRSRNASSRKPNLFVIISKQSESSSTRHSAWISTNCSLLCGQEKKAAIHRLLNLNCLTLVFNFWRFHVSWESSRNEFCKYCWLTRSSCFLI